jgi:hypothetical protein
MPFRGRSFEIFCMWAKDLPPKTCLELKKLIKCQLRLYCKIQLPRLRLAGTLVACNPMA